MSDVLDVDPGLDEAVPAEDPQPEKQQFTFPELFAKNYQDIVERLLSSSNSFNKIDNQQLRLKAVEVAERLTYWQFGGSPR